MPRITREAKQATKKRIVEEACRLFRETGFELSTTRDIAVASGIATGTLFGYFPTKEAIVLDLVTQGLDKARDEFTRIQREGASLEEDLFSHVSTGLRKLKKHRRYMRPVLETTLCPIARSTNDETDSLRTNHLEMVQQILQTHVSGLSLSPLAQQLYWTLYTGLLAFWADDDSPKQEDSRALLDQSISMFVDWLNNEGQS